MDPVPLEEKVRAAAMSPDEFLSIERLEAEIGLFSLDVEEIPASLHDREMYAHMIRAHIRYRGLMRFENMADLIAAHPTTGSLWRKIGHNGKTERIVIRAIHRAGLNLAVGP